MLDIALCSVESSWTSSTHTVAGWCPTNIQHICQMTYTNSRKHLPDDVSTWGIHLLHGWCPRTLNLGTHCNIQHITKIQLSIGLHACARKAHNIGMVSDWKRQIMLRHEWFLKVCFEKFADISEMLHPLPSTKLMFQSMIQYIMTSDMYFKFTCWCMTMVNHSWLWTLFQCQTLLLQHYLQHIYSMNNTSHLTAFYACMRLQSPSPGHPSCSWWGQSGIGWNTSCTVDDFAWHHLGLPWFFECSCSHTTLNPQHSTYPAKNYTKILKREIVVYTK